MWRKMPRAGLGAVMVFLNLAGFAAIGAADDGAAENAEQVQISNIPAEVTSGVTAYKIYIQLSTGVTAKAGYVAKGEALIKGETSVIIDLKKPDGQPWNDTGFFNFAIVISPETAGTSKDILVHGGEKYFSSKIQHIAWAPGLINLHDILPAQVDEIFDGIIMPDTGIGKK
ncbi:hypothetical protein AGMMS4952_23330 [Spirochaetia bacterium]|nr:hypothetical protein AGMMS4952_23330 [Spirochaetia bacterium]